MNEFNYTYMYTDIVENVLEIKVQNKVKQFHNYSLHRNERLNNIK